MPTSSNQTKPPKKSNRVEYRFRGDCRKLIASKEHEVVLVGPRDTGKTVASAMKLHLICSVIPGAQCGMVRKIYNSLKGTVLQTWERIIAGQGVVRFGGESPSKYRYANGSCVWVGGMDNPGKALSSERDAIYVNQCEELSLNEWEILAGCCSGRAAVIRDTQLFGDCNPAGSKHWIRQRAQEGKLRLLNATHKDNPELYTIDGVLTADGAKRIGVLENLSGVRRKRLFEGIWATAEGAVYDTFDASVHTCVRLESEMKRWFMAIDEGYTNPAVVLLIGEDSDGRWHCFKEFYQKGVLQSVVVAQARVWNEKRCDMVAVDESAAGLIADLLDAGLPAIGGKGRVLDGIQAIQDKLKVQLDGRPRLTIDPKCVNLINELESYCWKAGKDMPEKEFDHACDALRYLHDVLAEPTGSLTSASQIITGSPDSNRWGGPRVFVPRRL